MALSVIPGKEIQVTNPQPTQATTVFSSANDIEAYILLVFKDPNAVKIAQCESGLSPNAIGDKSTAYWSYGIYQVRALPGRPSPEWLLNPLNNINYAKMLYDKVGWSAWFNCATKLGLL